jgi:hypothetical protein
MLKKNILSLALIALSPVAFAQSHAAGFFGDVVFRQCQESMFGDTNQQCDCPKGNNYVECLISAKAIIHPDPKDIGNRGYAYVAVTQGDSYSVLNQSGQWIPAHQFKKGSYSTLFDPLRRTNVIAIPVPDPASLKQICSQRGNGFTVIVGYGAVSASDMDMGKKSLAMANELGQKFDIEMFNWSRARVDTGRNKKSGEIAQLSCRPVDTGGN